MKRKHKPDFLIVGMQRSGTHWVSALLNSHPEIACFPALPFRSENPESDMKRIGEVHLFNTLASLEPDVDKSFTRPMENFLTQVHGIFADLVPLKDRLPREEVYRNFLARYEELCEKMRGNKLLVGEDTPLYVFHLDFIDSFYPNIKKICIFRDPKDVVVSWHFNLIRKGRKSPEEPIRDGFVEEYCRGTIQPEFRSLLAYEGGIHCLTYEALHQHPRKAVKSLLDYLGVKYSDEIIQNMINEASFERLTEVDSGGRPRRPGEQSIGSHYRKGIVGDWKNNLTDKLAQIVDELTLELVRQVMDKYKISAFS